MAPETDDTEVGTSLPDGLTCGDCRHIPRCLAMFDHEPTDTYCDWKPSRFSPAPKTDA